MQRNYNYFERSNTELYMNNNDLCTTFNSGKQCCYGYSWFSAIKGPIRSSLINRKPPTGFSGSWIKQQQQPAEGCLYSETKLFHWRLDTHSRACEVYKGQTKPEQTDFYSSLPVSVSLLTFQFIVAPSLSLPHLPSKESSFLKLCIWGFVMIVSFNSFGPWSQKDRTIAYTLGLL